jgi:hypothetical protein
VTRLMPSCDADLMASKAATCMFVIGQAEAPLVRLETYLLAVPFNRASVSIGIHIRWPNIVKYELQ